MTLAILAVAIGMLVAAPAAPAEDPCLPENGCVPPVVAPPVPPDDAGDPVPVTIDWTPIPDVPPAITFDLGLPAPPKGKCIKHRRHRAATPSKRCKKKRH